MKPTKIIYLRKGRKKRAFGIIVGFGPNQTVKVKPTRDSWGMVWLSQDELTDGKKKPAYEQKENPTPRTKREKKPKAPSVPRWKTLVDEVRTMEIDHHAEGWPPIKMGFISELATLLEESQILFRA